MSYEGKRVQPSELRESFEQAWTDKDRAWDLARDTCLCKKPVRGTTCLGATKCARCQKTMRP